MSILCPSQDVSAQTEFNDCDAVLTSSTATFSYTDPGQTANTVYDVWLGSTALSNDIYDHAGGGTFNGTSVTVSNLPTDGRTIYKTLYVFRNGPGGGVTDTITCTCTAATIAAPTQINDCGAVLTSTSTTFSWNDPGFTSSTVYDFWIGSTPNSNDIYDLDGGGTFNGSSTIVDGLPLDGRTLHKTLFVFRNGPAGGITDTITCTCTAATIQNTDCMTFAQIRATGRSLNSYPTGVDYVAAHVAEFLYLNPDVSNWEVNGQEVCALPDPEPSSNAFQLPAPTGGNDSPMIQNAINNNAQVVGVAGAVYNLASIVSVTNATEIWDLATIATGSQSTGFRVNTANIKFYRCPINANDRPNFKLGWDVSSVGANFVVSRSGLRNVTTATGNAAGVWLRGGDNYKITCNEFRDMFLTAAATSTLSASILAVLNAGTGALPGGYIANNIAENIHARRRNLPTSTDPEFYKQQGYTSTASRPNIVANRCVNAGKRLAKLQCSDAFIASNFYHWRDRQGPLGVRVQQNIVNPQIRANRIRAINNRIKIEGQAQYDAIWVLLAGGGSNHTFNDVHFDCNDIELVDTPGPQTFYADGFYLKNSGGNNGGSNVTNSSARDNVWRGPGGTNYIFRVESEYNGPLTPSGLDISGNIINTPVRISDYWNSGANYVP